RNSAVYDSDRNARSLVLAEIGRRGLAGCEELERVRERTCAGRNAYSAWIPFFARKRIVQGPRCACALRRRGAIGDCGQRFAPIRVSKRFEHPRRVLRVQGAWTPGRDREP